MTAFAKICADLNVHEDPRRRLRLLLPRSDGGDVRTNAKIAASDDETPLGKGGISEFTGTILAQYDTGYTRFSNLSRDSR